MSLISYSANSQNVFIIIQTSTLFRFNNENEMRNFIQYEFENGLEPNSAFCMQDFNPLMFRCLFVYANGVPNTKFNVILQYNRDGNVGYLKVEVDPLRTNFALRSLVWSLYDDNFILSLSWILTNIHPNPNLPTPKTMPSSRHPNYSPNIHPHLQPPIDNIHHPSEFITDTPITGHPKNLPTTHLLPRRFSIDPSAKFKINPKSLSNKRKPQKSWIFGSKKENQKWKKVLNKVHTQNINSKSATHPKHPFSKVNLKSYWSNPN